MENVKQVIARARKVRDYQGRYNTHFDDLARVHIPRLLGFAETREDGEQDDDIFDGTPLHAARGLANTIGGLLRPDGEEWVMMKANDDDLNEDYDAKLWLNTNGERLRAAMENPKSRMRQCTGEVDLMLCVFGTGPFWLGENHDRNGLLFQSIPLKECAIDWGAEGVAAVYRFKDYTAPQAAEKWGKENLGELAQKALRANNLDTKFTYINAVMKSGSAGKFRGNMPISSLWIEADSVHVVQKSGFMEFPYIIPRMETSPGEDMGRSPAMISLPDANTLQAMGETILTAGQRAADPPIFAPNDGSFSAANTFPGGITYYDADLATQVGGNPIFPMNTGHNLPISRDMQQDTREQVFAAFFKNILNLPIAGPQMTATEVVRRSDEMKREIGPLFGRLEADYTAPMVERTFAIMMRAGAFTEIPEALLGKQIVFEYESPVKRVRQLIEVESARALKDEVVSLAEFDEEVMDNFDSDEYVRVMGTALRANDKLLKDPKIVEQIREGRAIANAERAKLEQAAATVDIAKTGAEAAKVAGLSEMVQ